MHKAVKRKLSSLFTLIALVSSLVVAAAQPTSAAPMVAPTLTKPTEAAPAASAAAEQKFREDSHFKVLVFIADRSSQTQAGIATIKKLGKAHMFARTCAR